MKRIIFSDLHLHTWPYGSKTNDDGFNSRLWAQYEALTEMVDYALEHGIEYLYFCGDMFHTHSTVPAQALHVAGNFFKTLQANGLKLRAIPGNHDFSSRNGSIHSMNWLPEDVLNGTWVDDGLTVASLPYTDDEEEIKRFLGDASELPDQSLVLLHQGVAGVPLSSGFLMDERLSADMIPPNVTAFTGHYHFFRRVTPNLTVVGNLTPLNWNDLGQEKGWVVFDDETREIEQIKQTRAPEFRLVGRDHRECGAHFIRFSEPASSGEQAEIRERLLQEGAITVEFPVTAAEERQEGPASTGEEVTLAHLIKMYESKELEPRRLEVGRQVREGQYAAPEM